MDRRYHVHDDLGPLRSFFTRSEAEKFMLPGMTLKVDPKPKRESGYDRAMRDVGEAPF